MILLHVMIAISSIVLAGYNLFDPSVFKLRLNYGLIALTFASGTYLVVNEHSPMLQACASGLFYLAIVSFAVIPVKIRLANK